MTMISMCPDAELSALLAEADSTVVPAQVADLLHRYPADPRLHFLRGSLLAGSRDFEAALAAMEQALQLDPGYALARFQLGLLKLTMGEAAVAEAIWTPLQALPVRDPLYCFVAGLRHLIGDQFDEAVRLLERGMGFNGSNAALNDDMARIVSTIRERAASQEEDDTSSATHLLLQQSALRTTRH